MAPSDPSSWTSVISTHSMATWLPLYHLFCCLLLLLDLDARQAVTRRSGAQLLEYRLQADDLPYAVLADSNEGLAFDRALSHAVR